MMADILAAIYAAAMAVVALGIVIAMVGREIALANRCEEAGGILVQHTCVPRLEIGAGK